MEKEYNAGNGQPTHNLLGISIEGETRGKLQTIITWSKITAIGGFVNMGLNLISTFITFNALSYQLGTTWVVITNIISLAISFSLNYFLLQFSKNLKGSLDNEDQESFVKASVQLKSYMRMLGILLIASIIIGFVSLYFIVENSRRF